MAATAASGRSSGAAPSSDRASAGAPASATDTRPSATAAASGRPGADEPSASTRGGGPSTGAVTATVPATSGRVRARKVRRIVRHIEPWSVLKISMLFYAALFLIVCVASALLWGAARTSGTVENVESFITSVGGFGNCEPIDGSAPVTTTVPPAVEPDGPVDQIDPGDTEEIDPEPGDTGIASPSDDEDCREGEELVGEFRFEDGRIFQAFTLGGIVLVLAGTAANVVMVLLFNLMSDLTGGVRLTVLEEDPPSRSRSASGSPPPRPRD